MLRDDCSSVGGFWKAGALVAALAFCAPARGAILGEDGADTDAGAATLTLRPAELSLSPVQESTSTNVLKDEPATETPKSEEPKGRFRFGDAGSTWITLGGGAADNFKNVDINIFGRYGHFIAQDIELFGELGAWAYSQPGKDATGFNLSMVVRWHWFDCGKWTSFLDAGIGVLATTRPVPPGGTAFDFTPRLGGGFTRQITDDGLRLELGIRWAHVSNARISGNAENPGRDSIMVYAGLIFPF
jgi:hypothetical protein